MGLSFKINDDSVNVRSLEISHAKTLLCMSKVDILSNKSGLFEKFLNFKSSSYDLLFQAFVLSCIPAAFIITYIRQPTVQRIPTY